VAILTEKVSTPIATIAVFIAIVGATYWVRGQVYYPHVVVDAQQVVRLEFLQQGLPSEEDCQAAVATVARAIGASCLGCKIVLQQCSVGPLPEFEALLSEKPIALPSSRLPRGIVTYLSEDGALALAACREAERVGASNPKSSAICYPPNAPRATAGSAGSAAQHIDLQQALLGLLVLLFTGAVSSFIGYLIVRYEALHAHWSHDPAGGGPQKFHATPTPRIGGLGIMASLFVAGAALLATGQTVPGEQFGYLLLASLPAFLGGITEDVTKSVSVAARLMLTMAAAAIGVVLLGAVIPRLDVPGFDTLLLWSPFAIAFTAFAVGGVANSINIIDGYNGLAAGSAVIVLAAMAVLSALLGDTFLMTSALAMIGALLGFLAWNYPRGKIFLGDGGAYLLGFWLGELSVLIVTRHPEVSPWFPMLLLVYPIFETLYSIYRRKIIEGQSPGQPDRRHMHQLIYEYLTKRDSKEAADTESMTRRNSKIAPYCWLMSLACAIPAVLLWKDTALLVTASFAFCAVYLLLYRGLYKASSRQPLRGSS
jgi:UDP-N-acetylmuramyl pentapeptide phosphotransferase/UDP-N-acetylglucosamine-1-phosphate transferase